MITRLVYNNKAFKTVNEYGYKFSSNEVTFNDIIIDFTGHTLLDIPYKFQEIKIMQADTEEHILEGTVLFTGYLDEIKLSTMKKKKEFREMTLTLLSPLKMATKRTVSLIGSFDIDIAITRILQPLIDDGFVIKQMNVTKGIITTNFVLETIEYCMNNIGFKRNIFWYINENKEIFVNSIEYLFGLPVIKIINKNTNKKEDGLLKIQPTIENIDYANVINFKNVRLIYSSSSNYPIMATKVLKNGDTVTFDNPIIIDEDTLRSYIKENVYTEGRTFYNFDMTIQVPKIDNPEYTENYTIGINLSGKNNNPNYNQYIKSDDITFSDYGGEEGKVVLQRDSFFSNLITGFKWNGEDNASIYSLRSDTALRYTTMRFMYSAEINKLKGIISNSGQIETTIDYNEKWTSLQQLVKYARSLMTQNSNTVNQVELEYDVNPNLKIGDIVEINEPDFYIEGRFAIKDISYTYKNPIEQNWKLTLKSSDLISTYIDMFRPAEKEENAEKINTVILSEFVEEQVNEKHYLELDNSDHTLNFNLEE